GHADRADRRPRRGVPGARRPPARPHAVRRAPARAATLRRARGPARQGGRAARLAGRPPADDPGAVRVLAARPIGRRRSRAGLERFLDGAVAGQASGKALSADELELLRKLGYAGDEEKPAEKKKP